MFCMTRDNLVDEKILKKFGKEKSLDFPHFLKEIKKISKELGDFDPEDPFWNSDKFDFKISESPQSSYSIYKQFNKFLSGCINWKSNRAQFNITPPVPHPTIVTSSITSLINPNTIWDVACGKLGNLEIYLCEYLASLSGWNKNSSGIFTFGGTGTNLYGLKIGINKCVGNFSERGMKDDIYVISNDEGHSCHVTLCNWLGIRKSNCIRVKTNKEGMVDVDELFSVVENLIQNGKKIGCIILNGGTNFNLVIDPIKRVSTEIKKISKKYKLDYMPHIHIDSVIGWVFLLFNDYCFEKNKLKIPEDINQKLKRIYSRIKEIKHANSFGVDFHKTGFCPYSTSTFILKNSNDWNSISPENKVFIHQDFNHGGYKPGQYSLETSRPATGIVSAYTTLNTLGLDGIRAILANYLYVSKNLRKEINKSKKIFNLNEESDGWATFFSMTSQEKSFDFFYECENEGIVLEQNKTQESFYKYLEKKYNNRIPWFIGYNKSYKKNKWGYPISCLKWYPMSPYLNTKSNRDFINWILKNFEQFLEKDI
jgi:L-2,4-diaminobutyrate decarboxylase